MATSIFCICGIRILWVFTVFSHFRTPEALYIVYPVSWIVAAIAHTLFFTYIWRHKNPLGKREIMIDGD